MFFTATVRNRIPGKSSAVLALSAWLIFFFPGSYPNCQTRSSSQKTKFTDGIYLDFEQWKNNEPIRKNKIVSSKNYNDKDFLKEVISAKSFSFYDTAGTKNEVLTDSIWGYTDRGVTNIHIQDKYFPVTTVGRICHFTADITYTEDPYYSPYSYYYPYRTRQRYPEVIYDPATGIYHFPYYYYNNSDRKVTKNESRQFLLDFDTGELYDFNLANARLLLMKDKELYIDFSRLTNKKQRELMFIYILKFNERNPLEIP